MNTTGSTDNIMKMNNFGLSISASTTAISTSDVNLLGNAAKQNNGYTYLRPRPNTDPARMGDYRNYNSDAIPFWEDDGTSAATAISSTYSVEAIVNDPTDTNVEITPEDFYELTQNKDEWFYRVLYKKDGSSGYQLGAAGDPLWINGYLNDQSASALIDFSLESAGYYDCCLILTRNTSTGGTLNSYLIPGSYVRVRYYPTYSPFNFGVNYDNDPLFTSTVNGDYCTSFGYRFDALNVEQGVSDFNLTIYLADQGGVITSTTYTAATLSDGLISGTFNGQFYKGSDASLDVNYLYVKVSYMWQGNPVVRYFDLGNEVFSTSQVNMSGSDFFDKYCMPHQ